MVYQFSQINYFVSHFITLFAVFITYVNFSKKYPYLWARVFCTCKQKSFACFTLYKCYFVLMTATLIENKKV